MFVFVCGMICAAESKPTKCTFVRPDKGETLLERCHGSVYPRALCVYVYVCVDNNLLDKQTETSPPYSVRLSSSHKAQPLPASHADSSAHAAEPPPQKPLTAGMILPLKE